VGCGVGHHSTLTRTHTYVNLRVIPGPNARTHESGVLPYPFWVFSGYPSGLGPIAIPTLVHDPRYHLSHLALYDMQKHRRH